MKYIKILSLVLLAGFIFNACNSEQDDLVTSDALEGGLLDVETGLVNYVVGDGATYTGRLKVYQGAAKTTQVKIYKQFKGADGSSSDVIEFKTLDISSSNTELHTFDFNYADLITGISVNGNPLPSDDSQLSIGDAWTFTFESVTSNGTFMNRGTMKAAVSTRFAGTYVVIESSYIHPTAGNLGGFNGETRIIESVDATTYHHLGLGFWTPNDDTDMEFYFTIDASDKITIPKEYNGETQTAWSGADELANCIDDPDKLTDVNCGSSDKVERDDVNKEDIIYLSYGYIRSSGTRQFYEVLQKVVE